MWSAIRRATSATTSPARASPWRAAVKISRGSYGGVSIDSTPSRLRELLGERADRGGRGVEPVSQPDQREVELAGGTVAARVQLAAQHEAASEPRADGEKHEVVDAARDALPLLPERREVDVVDERHVEPEPVAQVTAEIGALEAGGSGSGGVGPSASTTPGTPTTALPIRSREGSAASISASVTEAIAASAESGSGPASSTSWRTRSDAGEVAHCAAGEPGAEIEPEHERGIGDRLEEDGAEARAGGIVLGLAHEARRHERLQRERDGGLRDPDATRDLGARDRRVGAQGLEHGALVQVLEERRRGAGSGIMRSSGEES